MEPRTAISYTPDETIRLLTERAKTNGDRFVVKVSRRRGMAGLLEHIATLTEATVENIANPETWLPSLCGGGDYGLRVSHMDDVSTSIGGILMFKFQGQPLETPNVRAVGSKGWQGPGSIIFPAMTDSGLPSGSTGATVVTNGPAVVAGYGVPGAPGVPGMASHGHVPSPPVFYDERLERERERVAREARELAEQRAKTERQQAEREFELREKEREAKLKEELIAKQRELEAKIVAQGQSQTKMAEVVAALAPVIGTFLSTQQQARLEMLKMQEESARRHMELMQSMMAQQQAMMLKLTENKGVDPTISAVLEMMRANSSGSAEMMTRIVDAMGTVSKTSVGMIEAIADLQLGGQPEHPILLAVREGVKALSALSRGAESGARKQVQATQKALPQNGAAAPTQPVVVHEAPNAPAPNLPPVHENASGAQSQAFAGYSSEKPVEGKVVERLKALIEARHEPVEEVAQFFIASLSTNEMRAELAKHDGDVNGLIAEHLGLWAMSSDENREYLGRLGAAVDKLGSELGLVEEQRSEDAEA